MPKATDIRNERQPPVTQYIYPFVAAALRSHTPGSVQSDTDIPRNPGSDATGPPDQSPASAARTWDQGVEEGERRARLEFEQRLVKERESLSAAIRANERERTDYFLRVEAEVVQLALAIAAKILHRESQVDPMFLRGAVRSALDSVAAATEVRMRVHPERVSTWNDLFATHQELEKPPVVEADDSLELDQCLLETDLGTTDLGWQKQVKEVEQSFLDLLELRPKRK